MTTFWSLWIIILTTATIVGITWILFANRKTTFNREDNTTGHEYDGIVEQDNPLPAWWFSMFVITIVFGIGYLIAYPGMGNWKGVLDWTSAKQHAAEVAEVEKAFADSMAQFSGMTLEQMSQNETAVKKGGRLFASNCSVCHGENGVGSFGFPKLTDNDWIWGGSAEQIMHSIKQGRTAAMPSWKAALGDDGLKEVTQYVLGMSGKATDEAMATAGKAKYDMFCVACHGPSGDGNPMLGAPRLNDDIWLYGGDEQTIRTTLTVGRNGQMPAHAGLLSDDKIKLLTAYVMSISANAAE
jgi:cytochrome c oxidase cbb3-type subunit 3